MCPTTLVRCEVCNEPSEYRELCMCQKRSTYQTADGVRSAYSSRVYLVCWVCYQYADSFRNGVNVGEASLGELYYRKNWMITKGEELNVG
jgi:hypothetical protein